jgi:hypothetical protein
VASYTEQHLLPGERIVYQGRLHLLPFLPGYILGGLLTIAGVIGLGLEIWWLAIVSFLVAVPVLASAYIAHASSEFSITNKRVVIKTGWIRRNTHETMLSKVETIGVDQSLFGRLLDYGTITVVGTGGSTEPFRNIASPLEFRRQVQAQVMADGGVAIPAGADTPGSIASSARDERECPYCAELILRKAKVCKHCGRDVLQAAGKS